MPLVDGGDGNNIFSGTEIEVSFTPDGSTPVGCTATAEETWRVGDAGTTTRQGATAQLVDRPAGAASRCQYSTVFPASAAGGDLMRLTSDSPVVINGGAATAAGRYATVFSPDVSFEVPQINADDGNNIFAGTTLEVAFTRMDGSHPDCTADTVTESWLVNADGTATRQGSPVELVDRPAGQADGCSYNAEFQQITSAAVDNLGLASQSPVVVSAASMSAEATYENMFGPDVSITVTRLSALSGTMIRVTFTRTASAAVGCTEMAEGIWLVGDGGVVELSGEPPALVDRLEGVSERCRYNAEFPDPAPATLTITSGDLETTTTLAASLNLTSASPVEFASGDALSANYVTGQSTFEPDVDITAPTTDLFSGATIVVSYTRTDFGNCTETAQETWEIGSGGVVERQGPAAVLVAYLEGMIVRCFYDVELQETAAAGGTRELVLDSTSDTAIADGDDLVIAAGDSVSASYVTPENEFLPAVSISVPMVAALSGASILVSFTPVAGSNVGCTSTVVRAWSIGSGGLLLPPPTAVELISFPRGVIDRCEYNVEFPSTVSSAGGELTLTSDSPVRITADDTPVPANYERSENLFSPDVVIMVPNIDENRDDSNDFSGTDIPVSFSRVEGSHADCIETAEEVWQIADGEVAILSGGAAKLLNTPEGANAPCEYSVEFQETVPSAAGDLTLTSDSPVLITAAAASVAANYERSQNLFSPDVTIAVPTVNDRNGNNLFAGETITVSYDPLERASVNCTTGAENIWQIGDDGTATLLGNASRLLDFPDGESVRCSYNAAFQATVAYPDTSIFSATFDSGSLMLTSAPLVEVNASNTAADAVYAATDIVVNPAVEITVPEVNNFSGSTIAVSFARVTNSHAGCTAADSEIWELGNGGSVQRQAGAMAAQLVYIPAGSPNICQYEAVFPAIVNSGGLMLTAAPPSLSLAADNTFSTAYTSTESITFEPDVDIIVNATDFFSGAMIEVTFTSAASSPLGCTESASERWRLNNDGRLTPSGSRASLVDYPAGTLNRCSYDVAFQATVLDDEGVLTLIPPSSPLLVSATSRTVAASYLSRFFPNVSITVLDGDEDGDGVNDFSGIDITIVFSPISTAPSGCTGTFEETWQVGDNGVAQRSGEATSLSDLLEGQTNRCVYDIVFPETVADPNIIADENLILTSSSRRISAGNAAATAVYSSDSTFTPDVAITVTRLSALAGTMIRVTFTRTASADVGCTERAEEIWLVGDSGVVELSGEPPELVDRLLGVSERCRYNAEFQNPVPATLAINPTAPTIDVDLNLTSGSPVEFANGDALSANYVTGQSMFEPDVDITAPTTDLFSGATIVVSYTSADFGNCTETAQETWEIGNGGVVERQSSAVLLVAYSAGGVVRCSYDVAFQATVPAADGSGELVLDSVSGAVFAAGEPVAAGYVTKFLPDVTVTVPLADEGEVNDFSGTDITVTFTPTASSPAGCEAATETWRIGDDGTTARQGAAAQLVDRPAGAASRCQYSTVFPASTAGGDLILTSDSPVVIDGSAVTAAGSYTTVFEPEVTVTVPLVNGGDGNNIYSGTEIEVSFTPDGSTPAGCTATADEVWLVGTGGAATLQGAAAQLVDRPAGAASRCEYSTVFPASAAGGDLILTSDSPVVINSGAKAAAGSYASEFSPDVTFTLPDLVDLAGNSIFTGTDIGVTFARTAGSHTDCTATASGTWQIDASGAATLQTAAVLVGRPAGQTQDCVYTVTFPASVTAAVAGTADLTLEPAAAMTVSDSSRDATATYRTSDATEFTANVTVTVPETNDDDGNNIYTGTQIQVTFTPDGDLAGCTAAVSETWEIGTGGAATLQGAAAQLANRPAGLTTGNCSYDVTSSLVVENPGLRPVGASPAAVTAATPDVTIAYTAESEFSPNVTFTLPDLDDLDGNSIFTGTGIEVTFARTSSSHTDCTATASGTWQIDNSGAATLQTAAQLVGRPAGQTQDCVYNVTFPASVTAAAAGTADLTLEPAAAMTVSDSSRDATATYRTSDATDFTANVTITVPDLDDPDGNSIFTGTDIGVTFARTTTSHTDCTASASGTWQIDNSGAAAQQTAAVLVGRPAGQTQDCVYNVTFPASVTAAAAGTADLTLEPAAAMTVSDSSRDATATYRTSDATDFTANVTFTIPNLVDLDGNSIFTGTGIEVTFARTSSSHTDCTATASGTWQIDNTGAATQQTAAQLVGRPTGQTLDCVYNVTFPASVTAAAVGTADLTLEPAAAMTVSDSSRDAAATYETSDATEFTANVTVTVPETNDDDGNNIYTGTQIQVTFTPDGTLAGCTAAVSETWEIGTGGAATLQGAAAQLTNRPAGLTTGNCSYDVTSSLVVENPGLRPVGASPAAVTAAAPDVTVAYTAESEFSPNVTFTLPDLVDLDGNSIFTGTDIGVTFARTTTSHTDCTASASGTWQIDNTGSATRQTAAVLVGRPAGQTQDCVYNVTFPASVTAAAAGTADLTLEPAAAMTVSDSSRDATATYRTSAATEFTANVTITVPETNDDDGNNIYTGTQIQVTFTPDGTLAGCTASVSETWEIGTGGAATLQGAAAQLTNRPAGLTTGSCSYDVTSSLVVENPGLRPVGASPAAVTAAAPDVTVAYTAESEFSPNVTFTLPDLDDLDGNSIFTGTGIEVTFARTTTSHTDCTATASGTWQIDASGAAAQQTAAVLVGRPAGQTQDCVYNVTFPASVTAAAAGTADLTLEPAAAMTVSDSSRDATATYRTSDATDFTANVTITVPDLVDLDGNSIFAGTDIGVTFARTTTSHTDCTASASGTWQIDATGAATQQTAAVLVGRPAGQTQDCVYNVTFPASVTAAAAGTADLTLEPAAAMTVSDSSRDATATYRTSDATNFSPNVTFTVPDLDDPDGNSIFTGTQIGVTFARTTTSHTDCTATASGTWQIDATGAATQQTAAQLVGRPAGQTQDCVYNVTFPASVTAAPPGPRI